MPAWTRDKLENLTRLQQANKQRMYTRSHTAPALGTVSGTINADATMARPSASQQATAAVPPSSQQQNVRTVVARSVVTAAPKATDSKKIRPLISKGQSTNVSCPPAMSHQTIARPQSAASRSLSAAPHDRLRATTAPHRPLALNPNRAATKPVAQTKRSTAVAPSAPTTTTLLTKGATGAKVATSPPAAPPAAPSAPRSGTTTTDQVSFCSQCGKKYVHAARFCAYCGHRREGGRSKPLSHPES